LQHYSSLVALAQIELYTGDYEVAWKHIEGQVKPLEKSMLLRIQDCGSTRCTCGRGWPWPARPAEAGATTTNRGEFGEQHCQRTDGLVESFGHADSRRTRAPSRRRI